MDLPSRWLRYYETISDWGGHMSGPELLESDGQHSKFNAECLESDLRYDREHCEHSPTRLAALDAIWNAHHM